LGGLDEPTEGSVIFDGEDIYKLSGAKRAVVRNKKIGFVFQSYHLLPEFSALENVAMPALIKNRSQVSGLRSQAEQLLEMVSLKDRMHHRPSELSGGEQQRTAIARALVNSPGLLLCDEPTGNLDSGTGGGIIELLYKLNREHKATVVVVTHEEAIAKKAGKVVNIKDGVISES
jgi:lipoprotein-releasing system ATP-binding protein